MTDSRDEKIMELLEIEFKLRANELEDRKLVKHIRGFTFEHNEREQIINTGYLLFENIEDKEVDKYIDILFFALIKYKLNCVNDLSKLLQSKTTSNRREAQKEKSMLKGVDDIIDYLGGLVVKNEESRQLKMMLLELKKNPHYFRGEIRTNYYTKEDLKSDLRKIFQGQTDSINDLVNILSIPNIQTN